MTNSKLLDRDSGEQTRTLRSEEDASGCHDAPGVFATEMIRFAGRPVRIGQKPGSGSGWPLLIFNGIGGNIELLAPLVAMMPEREVITFDMPGVGQSELPAWPYRLRGVASLATAVLDHFEHGRADVLGVSWGGAAAQQFARSCGLRCRRLILCATATGAVMVPSNPWVTLKMATPRRYTDRHYARRVAGGIYGGDLRRDPSLYTKIFKHVRWKSRLGYYLQIAAIAGWTSIHWLSCIRQPTLIMAGSDDPLVPLANARLMHSLLPHSDLRVFDCGHLLLMTRAEESACAIASFLDRP